MREAISLCHMKPGQAAVVLAVHTRGSIRRRLLDIGLTPNTEVMCLGRSPGGDPAAYWIRGAVIAIRDRDGRSILVQPKEAGKWD